MKYEHTQRAPLHLIFYPLIIGLLILAWISRHELPVVGLLLAVALVLFLVALMFQRLTVRDEGDWLAVRYGPLPVFRTRIAYADVSAVERSRTSVIDGWGIHWIPGRGSTYNLWGFDCVKLVTRGRIVRVGTDDVDNLVAFLTERIEAQHDSSAATATS
jgi:hypothetical protein